MMTVIRYGLLALLLFALPLLGAWLAGLPLEPYLAFPPKLPPPEEPSFSAVWFAAIAIAVVLTLAPFIITIVRHQRTTRTPPPRQRMPWWGWLSGLVLALSWVLAWTRWSWAAPIQEYTFTPLWFSYIVLVNALCLRRAGRCLLTDRPLLFALLFPASALFWWFFEYLNRFVQNWHYGGVSIETPAFYVVAASVPFSTVLPAVLSTRDWLSTYPRLSAGLNHAWRPPTPPPRATALSVLGLSGLLLIALPVWPDQLYPLVWVAPLLALVSIQVLTGQKTLLAPLAHGNWRPLWLVALATVLCGLLWEAWNWKSLARWEYTVPYVDRLEIFEMPLLGYAGYLPFGLQCLAAAILFFGARPEVLYGLPQTEREQTAVRDRL